VIAAFQDGLKELKLIDNSRKFSLVVVLLAVLATNFGIGRVAADDQVRYRLKWLINMSTVGDVYAEQHGFFKEEGLRVMMKEGGPERDAIRELEMGHTDFGVASADQVIHAAAKGSPVVVIAQLFQANPLQWIYFQNRSDINSLSDLKGKAIGVTFGKNDEIIMRTLLAQAGLNENQVRLISVRLDYTPFYTKQADLWPVYINTQAVEIGRKLRDAGEKVAFLDPADHGVRFVANSIVTSARMLDEQPQLVRRFLRALLKGWAAAIDQANAEKAVAAVQKYDRNTAKALMYDQLHATRRLVTSETGEAIGHMDSAAWEQTEHIMLTHGQIEKKVNVLERLKKVDGMVTQRQP